MSRSEGAGERLSVVEVAREALHTYRESYVLLTLLALVVFVPTGLVEAAAHALEGVDSGAADGIAVAAVVTSALALSLAATVGDLFYTGVITATVGRRRTGHHRTAGEIARELPYLRLVAVDVLVTLAFAAGALLFIVPGVIAFTWFALAAPVVEIEDRGVFDALRRSRELVRGNFWPVLAVLGPTLLAADALAELIQKHGPDLLGEGFLGDWWTVVVAEALTAPFFALAAIVTTHHLISGRPDPV